MTLSGLLCLCFPLQLAPEQVPCLHCSQGDLTPSHPGFILQLMVALERVGSLDKAAVQSQVGCASAEQPFWLHPLCSARQNEAAESCG